MDQPLAHERARFRATPPHEPSGVLEAPRSAPVIAGWRHIAVRLAAESGRRERRLRIALSVADALALGVALLLSVVLASKDDLHMVAVLLLPAVIAAAKILGLYESDDQRIRKTTVEELPQLAQLSALLMLGVWLADQWLIGGPASKTQSTVLAVVFFVTAVLGRRAARKLTNRRLPRERCVFAGDKRSYVRLQTIFQRHELPADLIAHVAIDRPPVDGAGDLTSEANALLEVIARADAHRLIIGPHSLSNAMTFELLEAARAAGTRVSLLPDMLEVVGSSVDFDDL
ncbi:MAG TPA: hypothetical protein VD867_18575, partial [Burkholderiales bacterium]|nr:hypothetical protein [Burkholderiales bacterium]